MNMEQALSRAASRNISSHERDEIVAMLRTLPVTEVQRRTGRAYLTLFRIAEAAL